VLKYCEVHINLYTGMRRAMKEVWSTVSMLMVRTTTMLVLKSQGQDSHNLSTGSAITMEQGTREKKPL